MGACEVELNSRDRFLFHMAGKRKRKYFREKHVCPNPLCREEFKTGAQLSRHVQDQSQRFTCLAYWNKRVQTKLRGANKRRPLPEPDFPPEVQFEDENQVEDVGDPEAEGPIPDLGGDQGNRRENSSPVEDIAMMEVEECPDPDVQMANDPNDADDDGLHDDPYQDEEAAIPPNPLFDNVVREPFKVGKQLHGRGRHLFDQMMCSFGTPKLSNRFYPLLNPNDWQLAKYVMTLNESVKKKDELIKMVCGVYSKKPFFIYYRTCANNIAPTTPRKC